MENKMYNRTIKIIRTLVGHEKMSSVELMDKLKISQRTLRAEIKEANKFLQRENVFIHSSSTGGYYVKQEDRAQVQKVLDAIIEESKRVIFPETPDERFLFGISWLFFLNEPVSIQKLAEKLYVSKTAMLQTKKQIQDTIRWYHGLFLESGKKGMWIVEMKELRDMPGRNFKLSDLWLNPNGACDYFFVGSEKYEDYILLYHQLPQILSEHGYRLIDKAIEGFALDIFISLMRTDKQFVLEEQMDDISCENACVESICAVLCEMGYHVGGRDQLFLEECLSAKRVLYVLGKDYHIPEEYLLITDGFLDRVDRRFHTDYQNNPELLSRLSVHIMKMIKRIQQGYFETNPVLEDILNSYERDVEAADELNKILEEKYHIKANIHELCYIAIYLRAYYERRLKAVVLCDIGESIADNMMRRINDYCGDRIEILNKMSLAEYRLNPLPVDLLISTARVYNVNLSKKTKVIYVDYLMNEENLKDIQEYLLQDMQKE